MLSLLWKESVPNGTSRENIVCSPSKTHAVSGEIHKGFSGNPGNEAKVVHLQCTTPHSQAPKRCTNSPHFTIISEENSYTVHNFGLSRQINIHARTVFSICSRKVISIFKATQEGNCPIFGVSCNSAVSTHTYKIIFFPNFIRALVQFSGPQNE